MAYRSTGDVKSTLSAISSVATTALNVSNDPALPKVVSLLGEIKDLPSKGPFVTEQGIGLSKIVRPLELYIAYKKNPWIVPAALTGAVIVIFAAGRFSAKRKRI